MADDNTAEIKVSANTGEAESALQHLASTAEESLHKMLSGFDPVMSASVALGEAIEKLGEEAFEKLKEYTKEAIESFSELGEQVEHLQLVIGGSAESVSDLTVALAGIGVSTQAYEGFSYRLELQLKRNTAAFEKYGIATKDNSGGQLDQQTLITNVISKLREYEEGTERARVGTELLGRGYRSIADLMKLTSEEQERATAVAKNFGLELSGTDVEAAHEFEVATNLLGQEVKGFAVEIGRNLTPILSVLADFIGDVLLPVFDAFKIAMKGIGLALDLLSIPFIGLGGLLGLLYEGFVHLVNILAIAAQGLSGDLVGATKAAIAEEKRHEEAINRVTAAVMRQKAAVESHFATTLGAEDPNKAEGKKEHEAAETPVTLKNSEKELADRKIEAERNYHKLSAEEEVEFWKEKLSEVSAGTEDQIGMLDKYGKALAAASSEGLREANKAADERFGHEKKLVEDELALNAKVNAEKVKLGTMTVQEADAAEIAGIEKVTAMEVEHLQQQSNRAGLKAAERQKFIDQETEKVAAASAKIEGIRNKDADETRKAQNIQVEGEQKLLSIALQRIKAENEAALKLGQVSQQTAGEREEGALAARAGAEVGKQASNLGPDISPDSEAAITATNKIREIIAQYYLDVASLRQKDLEAAKAAQEEQFAHEKAMLDLRQQADSAANKTRLAQGQITQRQLDAIDMKAALDSIDLDIRQTVEKMVNMDKTSAAYQKLQDQLGQLDAKRGLVFAKEQEKEAQAFQQTWNQVTAQFNSAFTTAFDAIINHTETFHQAVKKLAGQLGMDIINDLINKVLLQTIETNLLRLVSDTALYKAMTTNAQTQQVAQRTMDSSAAATQEATNLALGVSYASVAGAAGVASAAAIPVYGWSIAPEAGGLDYAAAIGYMAEGGFDVPHGINPVTQLHAREMVLPAHLADPLRQSINSGNIGGGGETHLHVHAVDSKSVQRLFDNHGATLAKTLRSQLRNFSPANLR